MNKEKYSDPTAEKAVANVMNEHNKIMQNREVAEWGRVKRSVGRQNTKPRKK